MDSVNEQWRPIPGYPEYLASDHGNIDALVAFVPTKGSKGARRMIFGEEARHRIRPFESVGRKRHPTSYQRVYMWRFEDGVRSKVQLMVHRLVLLAFVGPCPPGHEASHLNGRRDDNRLSNLAWETPEVNYERRIDHRTTLHGERHFAAKLTNAQALEIRKRVSQGELQKHLASEFGVSKHVVNSLVNNRSWTRL